MIIEAENLDLTNEERAMGVASASAIEWGRTTVVKMQTTDNYEVVGMYTVGRQRGREDVDPVCVMMARGNAMQRLQHAMERRQTRGLADQRIAP